MKWLRKLLGTDFPDPVVGQVWRSRHSGQLMRVTGVRFSNGGTIFVDAEHQYAPDAWTVPHYYAIGIDDWRRSLREEARELVAGPGWRLR